MSLSSSKKEWSDSQHVLNYLNAADTIPHRSEGESVLLDNIPKNTKRILDLGTGDGRLIKLVKSHLSNVKEIVALDVSPIMIKALQDNFSNDSMVKVIEHDLEFPLPDMGHFDAVISAFAIHHLKHKRKYTLYEEIYNILYPTGVFCNFEHVSSPSVDQHNRFLKAISRSHKNEDNTNRLLSMEKQLQWLKELGFVDVDCYWKWLELALLTGYKL